MFCTAQDPEGRSFDPELARMIDHTLLRPEATAGQIRALCQETSTYGFASVCIHPLWVPLATETLAGTNPPHNAPTQDAGRATGGGLAVCTVVGFPHGAQPADVKAFEAELAVRQGAGEIDMVIPIGALKQG
ncbi:MAG: hypothetical protein KAY24_04495, partial [Candidatus Eisenbacteria sp.]|nr:hypothetical protein [Candidatus Eisenbacteria bacterium]